jgi:WD40 repeat protein
MEGPRTMSPESLAPDEQLTPEEAAEIDAVCDRFERAWKETKTGGPEPRVATYVGHGHGAAREVLFRELVALEQACRERYGRGVRPGDSKECAGAEPPATHYVRNDIPTGRNPDWPSIPGLELVDLLGSGGMGVVFKARQVTLDRDVAVKFLRDDYRADPGRRERFLQEARAVARLRHPHLVQLYEFGEVPGMGGVTSQPYLVLEYVSGGSLADLVRSSPQPPIEAARLVETLAEAIHYAHQQGVIHRDLKPANVLLQKTEVKGEEETKVVRGPRSARPRPLAPDICGKVTDFGLAKFLVGSDLTHSGDVLGTPSYMAPEQAEGKAGLITAAVDVYGLGAILYEALTGRPPFAAATADATLGQVRRDEPVPPRRLQPTVPRDLETICLKCLRKEAGRRYATAQDLADDLRRFQAGEPVRARPVGMGERVVVWCRRKPFPAALLTSVAFLVLLLAVGTPLAAFLWHEQRDEARHNANLAAIAEREARDKLRQSYLDQAVLLHSTRQSGQRFKSLELLREASSIWGGTDIRNTAIACLALPDLKTAWHRPLPASSEERVAFDALLKRYAYLNDHHIIIRSVADDRELVALPGPRSPSWTFKMTFSPDGRYFATVFIFKDESPSKALVWDLSQGDQVLEQPSDDVGFGLDFSPDSGSIALAGGDGSIGIFAIPGGQELSRLEKSCRPRTLVFDPTGRRLAVSSGEDKVVEIRDLDKGGRVEAKFDHPSGVFSSAWRGDGKLLATGCNDRNAYVWDVSASRQLAILSGHKGAVSSVAFNHAGDLLASGSWDGTTKLWDAVGGVNLLTVQGYCHHFAGDDEQLAHHTGTEFGIWQVAGRRECRTLHFGRVGRPAPEVDNGGPWSVDFSSDGQLLAAAGEDGVHLWDMPAGREVAHLPTGHSESALFLPGETSLITSGRNGLQLWPIQRDQAGHGDTSIGPAVLLQAGPKSASYRVALSQDGKKIAYLDYRNQQTQTFVMDAKTPENQVELNCAPRQQNIALSPTGRWAAGGNWRFTEGARVWDLTSSTTAPVWQLRITDPGSCRVGFSPDGQWLVTSEQDKYRFWQVGTWAPGLVIPRERLEPGPGPVAFTRDSRMLTIARSAWTVQVIELATEPETGELSRRGIGILSAPDPQIINSLCFSPDAGQLAVATNNHTIQLWDLRLIRRELAEMNLNWDLPLSR